MVRHVLAVPRGQWLLQSAAGSELGRMIIRLARRDGIRTLNVVRRRESVAALEALGADVVIMSTDRPIDEQVHRIVGRQGVKSAIDPSIPGGSVCGARATPVVMRSCSARPTLGCGAWSRRSRRSAATSRGYAGSRPTPWPRSRTRSPRTSERRRAVSGPGTRAIVSADPAASAAYSAPDAIDFYRQPIPEGIWENMVTVRSARAARMYEPGVGIGRVSPTPLLMVVALNDTIILTDLALAACERALEPKRVELIPGGHFEPYLSSFTQASAAARAWFHEHLS
jgi:hypothetical protein